MIMYPLISALIIIADQITKYMVRSGMQPGDSIPVIGEWLRIYYVRNTGTAFSMFSGNKMITIVLTSVLIIGCLVYAVKEARSGSKITALFLTMIASGGLSNLIDRLTLGYVTDMISCSSFAVFNVADCFVTVGAVLLAIYLLFLFKDETPNEIDNNKPEEETDVKESNS